MSGLRLDHNLFKVGSVDELPLEKLIASMERETYACIRGLVSPEEIDASLIRIQERFDCSNDHPAAGQSSDAVRSNFQKLNIGERNSNR